MKRNVIKMKVEIELDKNAEDVNLKGAVQLIRKQIKSVESSSSKRFHDFSLQNTDKMSNENGLVWLYP